MSNRNDPRRQPGAPLAVSSSNASTHSRNSQASARTHHSQDTVASAMLLSHAAQAVDLQEELEKVEEQMAEQREAAAHWKYVTPCALLASTLL